MALPSLPKRLPKSCGLGEQPRHLPPANRTPSCRLDEAMTTLVMGLQTLCLDFGKNPEPEPGRCRRTDGKKWRCCRNVIPNEKYCERHMHRSRKRPVQLVVEDDEPDSASGSKSASSKATEGVKKTDDKSSISKNLAVEAPAAV